LRVESRQQRRESVENGGMGVGMTIEYEGMGEWVYECQGALKTGHWGALENRPKLNS
jgi:hypothetical protein